MTTITVLPYNREPIDIGDLIDFDPKPGPRPEAMLQNPILFDILYMLAGRFADFLKSEEVLVDINSFICYDRDNLNVRVMPDCYLAFGVDTRAIRERRLYLPWEVGKVPDFVMEVASETTAQHDLTGKRDIYLRIGIPEYWRFDPTGGEHYGQPLAADRLADGEYQPIELTTEPDGLLKGYSEILGLYLCADGHDLRLYDPDTGRYVRNAEQDHYAHEEVLSTLSSERNAHEDALSELRSERRVRESDQARIRQLEEQLRRLQDSES